ncbi:MAG: FG-GAP repeat protein [Ignavibacteria bacterium]|nr:FG-GAP repeat protein [Ignavibacteria bacterium]
MNGDGYSDVIVGAHGYNAGTDLGSAYIYLGGAIMNNAADVTLIGYSAGDKFGYSVSSAGDVDGDGYSDVIVGAYGYNGAAYQGRVYIFFGGASMNSYADVILTGVNSGDYFGRSVSGAGDMNGDGFDDVIVGADGYNIDQGRAYIFFGGVSMNSTADVILTGVNSGDYFGRKVSSAGDVNGDGYGDVLVTAFAYYSGFYKGRVYNYFGGNTVNNSADLIYTGEEEYDNFGISHSGAGDVNGDGLR